jgi:hypothetical protein
MFVDGQQDAWLMPLGPLWISPRPALELIHYRAAAGAVERTSIPFANSNVWAWMGPHPDGRRGVVLRGVTGGPFEFNFFDPTQPYASSLQQVATIASAYSPIVSRTGNRVYFTSGGPNNSSNGGDRLMSLSLTGTPTLKDHGLIRDQNGRRPMRLGGIAADGRGHVYVVGDWYTISGDLPSLRNGNPVPSASTPTTLRFAVINIDDESGSVPTVPSAPSNLRKAP